MLRSSFTLVVLAAACGGAGVVSFDPGATSHHVVDAMHAPTNNTEAREFALDLNGDGAVDNQLGTILGAFAGWGFPIQPSVDAAIAEGNLLLLVEIVQNTEVSVFFGANPQPPACAPGEMYTCDAATPPHCTGCGHHLGGDATFDVDPGSVHPPLVGTTSNGLLLVGPGPMAMQISLGNAHVIAFDLVGARAAVAVDANGAPTGTITLGGGLVPAEYNDRVAPELARIGNEQIQLDCCGAPTSPGGATCNPSPTGPSPSCGCVSGSAGGTILGLFDVSPRDCVLSAQEIIDSSLAKSLASPDVTLGGQLAISLGVQVSITGAEFTPP
jgi:hypothetical protein